MKVVKLHEFPELLDDCCDLINNEWPRSKTARMRSLETSTDYLPTCMVMTQGQKVIGHGKLSHIPTLPSGCFVESVVIHPAFRGQGLGRELMSELENHAKSLGLSMVYLSTVDQQEFYKKLGYAECEPVSIYGSGIGYQHAKISKTVAAINNTDISISNSGVIKTSVLPEDPHSMLSATSAPHTVPLSPAALPCSLPPLPPPLPSKSLFLSEHLPSNLSKKSTTLSKRHL